LSQRVVTRLRALVVLPTRDLCIQVKETFETFVKGTDLKIATSTGQNSFAHEQTILVGDINSPVILGGQSRIDVLITTPGRLIDHIKSTPNFTLQHLRFLVIDEADRLLNQSFQDWLHHILTAIHPSDRRLTEKGSHSSNHGTINTLGQQNQLSDDERLGLGLVQLKTDEYGFPIHDAIAPGFLPSFFDLPESDVEDPKALSVQKLLFSATLTRNPAKIASLQLSDPQYVAVQEVGEAGEEKQKYTTPAGLTVRYLYISTRLSTEGKRDRMLTLSVLFLAGTYDCLRNFRKATDGVALVASSSGSLCLVFYKVRRICSSSVQAHSAL